MKRQIMITVMLIAYRPCLAATTIDPANKHAYGANIGWINVEADSANGAVIGQAFCSGYLYAANVGWIHLGDGTPDNGIAYGNDSATDFGVNHDGLGNLTGYAYGANIGWINFEETYGQPKVNLETGDLSGYTWSGNVGWTSLDGVNTLILASGPDSDNDTIPDFWEYAHTNTLDVLTNGGADSDDDGVTDTAEYGADTDPFDASDFLQITALEKQADTNLVTWTCVPTRLYTLQYADILTNDVPWTATGPSFVPHSGPETSKRVDGVIDDKRFYRIKAGPPLAP
jgi:hypothetical protein